MCYCSWKVFIFFFRVLRASSPLLVNTTTHSFPDTEALSVSFFFFGAPPSMALGNLFSPYPRFIYTCPPFFQFSFLARFFASYSCSTSPGYSLLRVPRPSTRIFFLKTPFPPDSLDAGAFSPYRADSLVWLMFFCVFLVAPSFSVSTCGLWL